MYGTQQVRPCMFSGCIHAANVRYQTIRNHPLNKPNNTKISRSFCLQWWGIWGLVLQVFDFMGEIAERTWTYS